MTTTFIIIYQNENKLNYYLSTPFLIVSFLKKNQQLFKLVLFVSIFFWTPKEMNSQTYTSKDSILGYQYYKIADKSWRNIDTCKYYSFLALPLLKKTKQWNEYIWTLCGLSYCYQVREEFDSMEINNVFAFDEAKRVLTPNDSMYHAALNNLGLILAIKEQDLKALACYKEAYSSFDTINIDFRIRAANEENIGRIYSNFGDFNTAKKYLLKAIDSWERVGQDGKKNHFIKLAKTFQKLAELHYNFKHYKKAKSYALKSLKSLEHFGEYPQNDKSRYTINLAKIDIALGNYNSANTQLNQILQISNLPPAQKMNVYHNLGLVFFKKGDISKAICNLKLGLQQLQSDEIVRDKAAIFKTLGDINIYQGEYLNTLKNQQNAVRLLSPNAKLINDLDTPTLSSSKNGKLELFKTLVAKSKTTQRLFEDTGQLKYLEATFNTYQYLSHLTDDIRSFYQSNESQLLLLDKAKDFYEEAIATSFLLFEKKKDPNYLNQAFFFAEKSKSELLLEELRKKEFSGKGIISDSLLQKQYEIKTAINYNQKLLKKESAKEISNQTKIKNFENILFGLQRDLSDWKDRIQETYPTYSSITQQKPIELNDLQKKLNSSQILLEYFVGEKNIFLFKITSDKVDLIKIPNAYNLDQFIETLSNHLKMTGENGLENYSKIAFHLYQKLLPKEKIKLDKKDIIIIPDGPLENLPFGILLTSDSLGKSPRALPYFIKKHVTSYAYSATIYANQFDQKPIKNAAIAGVFPIFEGSEKELLFSPQVHQSLSRFSGNLLLKEQATVGNFLEIVEDFQIIHFSTHARHNDGILQEPSIDFADSSLLLSDLQTYNLSASLAVLSACETNVGEYQKGEGTMSLSRGFAFAGVPSMITSTSNVREESTSIIMKSLYNYLEKGLPKHEALRQAKLDYLTSENTPDVNCAPYFWGTFLAIGNMDKITFQYPSQRKYWFGVLGILIIGCLLFFYKRKL